jgi:hypothetical protein
MSLTVTRQDLTAITAKYHIRLVFAISIGYDGAWAAFSALWNAGHKFPHVRQYFELESDSAEPGEFFQGEYFEEARCLVFMSSSLAEAWPGLD